MTMFSYTAKDIYGKTVTGTYEASTREEVVTFIREKKYIPLEINHKKDTWGGEINFKRNKKVKIRDLAVWCRQFSTTLKAGITVVDSLDILRKQTTNGKLAEVLGVVCEDIQKGSPLSISMANEPKIFPHLLTSMVETGEISGNLEEVMDDMAVHFEKEHKINQKVKTALTYPIIVSIVAIAVVIGLLVFVMPTFISMFNSLGAELPTVTKVLLSISDSLKKYWYVYVLVTGIIIYVFRRYTQTTEGRYKYDKFKMTMPLFGQLSTKVVMSRFASTLSVLLTSGVDIINAVEIVQRVVGNEYIKEQLDEVKEGVKKGFGLGRTMENTGGFPPMVYQMVDIGENSGTMDYVLEKVAEFYDAEVETAINQLTTMIEPIIIVVLGGIVLFIVSSIILPMFDMYGAIQ